MSRSGSVVVAVGLSLAIFVAGCGGGSTPSSASSAPLGTSVSSGSLSTSPPSSSTTAAAATSAKPAKTNGIGTTSKDPSQSGSSLSYNGPAVKLTGDGKVCDMLPPADVPADSNGAKPNNCQENDSSGVDEGDYSYPLGAIAVNLTVYYELDPKHVAWNKAVKDLTSPSVPSVKGVVGPPVGKFPTVWIPGLKYLNTTTGNYFAWDYFSNTSESLQTDETMADKALGAFMSAAFTG